MTNISEDTKNNRYFFIDTAPNTEKITLILDASKNMDMQETIMPELISTEAVELIKEAEAVVLERYQIGKDAGNVDSKKMWDKHTRLVQELMYLRRYTKKS